MFSVVLMTMAILIFTVGNYPIIHAASTNNNPISKDSASTYHQRQE